MIIKETILVFQEIFTELFGSKSATYSQMVQTIIIRGDKKLTFGNLVEGYMGILYSCKVSVSLCL